LPVRDDVVLGSSSRRSSFIPHLEQLVGLSLCTSGCIGQLYRAMLHRLASAEPDEVALRERRACPMHVAMASRDRRPPAVPPPEESVMTTKKSRRRDVKRRPMRAESPGVKPKKKGELPPEQAADQELPEYERTRERERE
jgi:hypothetical protein